MTEESDLNLVQQLADEFAQRLRRGERPSINEYAQRYPGLAELIRDTFEALAMMENAAPASDPPALAPESSDPELTHLGDYRIIREIGRGGMGIVYEAEQESLGRHVALKVMPRRLLQNSKQRMRFLREAKTAAKLHHTNIVPVFGVGEDDGLGYYVMQFIQGQGLDAVLHELRRLRVVDRAAARTDSRGAKHDRQPGVPAADMARSLTAGFQGLTDKVGEAPVSDEFAVTMILPVTAAETLPDRESVAESESFTAASRLSETLESSPSSSTVLPGKSGSGNARHAYSRSIAQIGVQIAEALNYAHGQGVLHRDIKPANLLLDLQGTVWVTDFGLAKLDDDDGLTQTGDILGTLRYMAPETFKHQSDARSEVYSLGLTLYELLAFRPAFDQVTRSLLIDQVMNARVEWLERLNPDVPVDLQTIVHKAIERDPGDRYQTAEEFADDLKRFVNDEPIRARRVTLPERLARWSRRNRGLAAALSLAAALLLLINIAGPLLTWELAQVNETLQQTVAELEQKERQLVDARDEAEDQANQNLALAEQAEDARQDSLTMLADHLTERGLLAAGGGKAAEAMLWFVNAAEQTPHDPVREALNRARARNWMNQAVIPVASLRLPLPLTQKRLEFQPQGRLLLIATLGDMRIWDWESSEILPWTTELAGVTDACWSPNGKWVAIGFEGGMVQIRAASSGEIHGEVHCGGRVETLCFSPDNTRLATATHVVQVWNCQSEFRLDAEWQHPLAVYGLVFNASGTQLATACDDLQVRVFGLEDQVQQYSVPHDPELKVCTPIFLNEDRLLITVLTGGHHLGWWDAESGQDATPPETDVTVEGGRGLVPSPDGRGFAVATGNSCDLWTVEGERNTLPHPNHVMDVAYSPSGETVLTGGFDWHARLWSPGDRERQSVTIPMMQIVQLCDFSSDGRHAALYSSDEIRICHLPEATALVGRASGWDRNLSRPRVGPAGRLATPGVWHEGLPTSWRLNALQVIETGTGAAAGPAIRADGIADSCLCADGSAVAVAMATESSGQVVVFDIASGQRLASSGALPGPPHCVACRPGHQDIATLCTNGSVVVFDQQSGTWKHEFEHEAWPGLERYPRVAYSPDGSCLVTVTVTSDVIIREADTGALRYPPIRPVLEGGPCRAVAFSRDGRWLATGVNGVNAVQVWDLLDGRPACSPIRHPGQLYGIFTIAFSPDGRWIVSGNKDGRARVWEWASGTLVCPPLQHPDEVLDVAFTADGRHALTGVRMGGVRVWDVVTGKPTAPEFELLGPYPISAETLVVTDDRAIIGAPGFPILDLDALLSDPDLSNGSLRTIAELATGGQLELGELNLFTADEWHECWAELTEHPFSRETLLAELARELDRDTDVGWLSSIAARAARRGLLLDLLKLRPNVAQLEMEWARELERQRDFDRAAEHRRHAVELCEQRLARNPGDQKLSTQLACFLAEPDSRIWSVMEPRQVTSEAGITFQFHPDQSILAEGGVVNVDTYTIAGTCDVSQVNGIRLEVLPHPDLPWQGPGWSDGNFHLTEIRAEIDRKNGTTLACPLRSAVASFSRPAGDRGSTERDGPAGVLDGDQSTRWDISPNQGKRHWLAVGLDQSVQIGAGDELSVQLDFRDPVWPNHRLGSFRLSVTDDVLAIVKERLRMIVLNGVLTGDTALAAAYIVHGRPDAARQLLEGPDAIRSPEGDVLRGIALHAVDPEQAQGPLDEVAELLQMGQLSSVLHPLAGDTLVAAGRRNRNTVEQYIDMSVINEELSRLGLGIEQDPGTADRYYERAVYSVRLGRWRDGANDFLTACGLVPDVPFPWFCAAICLALTGDDVEYQEHCAAMVERFRSTVHPHFADVVCKGSLLKPGLVALSELPVQCLQDATEDPAWESHRPFFRACQSLISLRSGQPEQALEWTETYSDWAGYPLALALTVRALAEQQLGRTESARVMLENAGLVIPAELRTLGTDGYDGTLPVPESAAGLDWLLPEILRREAELLISNSVATQPE